MWYDRPCPNCGEPMRLLFSSFYCKGAVSPEAVCAGLRITVRGKTWRVQRISRGNPFPKWATRAWNLNGYEPESDASKPDAELALLHQARWECQDTGPGWSILNEGVTATVTYDALVFAPIG